MYRPLEHVTATLYIHSYTYPPPLSAIPTIYFHTSNRQLSFSVNASTLVRQSLAREALFQVGVA